MASTRPPGGWCGLPFCDLSGFQAAGHSAGVHFAFQFAGFVPAFVVVDADKYCSLVSVQSDAGDIIGTSLKMNDFGLVPGKPFRFGNVYCRGPGKVTPRPDSKSGKTEVLSVEFEPKVNGNPLRKDGVIIKRITFEVRLRDKRELWIGHYGFEFEEP